MFFEERQCCAWNFAPTFLKQETGCLWSYLSLLVLGYMQMRKATGLKTESKQGQPETWRSPQTAARNFGFLIINYSQLQRCPEPRLSSLYSLTLCDFLFQVLSPHLFALRDSLLNSEHSQHPVARISRDILPALQKISCLGLSSCQFNPELPGSHTRRDAGRGTPTSPSPTCGSGRIFY